MPIASSREDRGAPSSELVESREAHGALRDFVRLRPTSRCSAGLRRDPHSPAAVSRVYRRETNARPNRRVRDTEQGGYCYAQFAKPESRREISLSLDRVRARAYSNWLARVVAARCIADSSFFFFFFCARFRDDTIAIGRISVVGKFSSECFVGIVKKCDLVLEKCSIADAPE